MKINGGLEVLTIAEAAGLFLDRLDRRVQRLADGAGDPVGKEGQDVLQVFAEHCSLLRPQQGKIPVQALLPPVILDMLHCRRFQVVDQGQIVVPFAQKLLVHSHFPDRLPRFPLPPSEHGPAHNLPGLVPTDHQNLSRPLDAGFLQHQNGQPLKKRRKSLVLFRPADLHLFHSVRRTLHPRNPGMKKRLELTGVQMTSRALRRAVIHRKIGPAFGTRPTLPFLDSGPFGAILSHPVTH